MLNLFWSLLRQQRAQQVHKMNMKVEQMDENPDRFMDRITRDQKELRRDCT